MIGEGNIVMIGAAGADFLRAFVWSTRLFCREFLAWASPDLWGEGQPAAFLQPAAYFHLGGWTPAPRKALDVIIFLSELVAFYFRSVRFVNGSAHYSLGMQVFGCLPLTCLLLDQSTVEWSRTYQLNHERGSPPILVLIMTFILGLCHRSYPHFLRSIFCGSTFCTRV